MTLEQIVQGKNIAEKITKLEGLLAKAEKGLSQLNENKVNSNFYGIGICRSNSYDLITNEMPDIDKEVIELIIVRLKYKIHSLKIKLASI